LSGGTLDIRNSTGATPGGGTFYVASRGAGVVNISGTSSVMCNILDVSRDITNGTNGTVNLNGGTLLVNTRITTANANSVAANTLSSGTFNFNGGPLKAGSPNPAFITENTEGNANHTPMTVQDK